MVMATPSPQQVGREFVRQYYTLLHEAPEVLHRFYSSGSTFVHGGIDRPGQHAEEPVTGQLDIDKKIKELSFKDCHTKIRQVDSQATIGSGVVVQVTGELSNNGEPMRRFMQTFVLAPQSAKKFYVHNDIFRYQDEVYQDNSDTESEDHQTIQEAAQQAPAAGTAAASTAGKPAGYYQQAGADHHHHHQQQPETNHHLHNNNNHHQHHHHEHQETPAVQQQTSIEVKGEQPNLLVNGHSNNVEQQQQQPNVAVQELAPQPQRVAKEDGKENKNNNVELFSVPAENHHESVKTNSVVGGKSAATGKDEKEGQQDSKSSWAKIIGTNRSTGNSSDANSTNALTSSQNFQGGQSQTTSSASIKFGSYGKDQKIIQKGSASTATQNGSKGSNNKTTKSASSGSSSSNKEATGGVNAQSTNSSRDQQKEKRGGTQGGDMGNSLDTSLSGNLEDDKRFGRYPDGQQVFVGNLNQELSETELRSLFGQYGKVVEVRINTNSKQQSGRRLPNYGFVVFDDQKTVDNLLGSSKSNNILYKSEKGVEYRLNVEEKRARQGRVSSGFGGGNSNNGGSGGKSNRATRSSSNGSRNGPNNNNTNGTSSSKKNSNNTTNDYINEKKREIHEHNNNHQMIENSGGGNFHKNASRRS